MSNLLGYAASLAVLTSFLMRSMVPLRLAAILSNILFISFGYLAHIHPVLLLHTALLPINIARLSADWRGGVSRGAAQVRSVTAPATGRIPHVWLFLLGVAAGSLGIRTFIHVAFVLFSQCREGVA
jgi:hypothetical protein